ncbi:hypothetical protein [Candidatus Protochlamydia sp. R18]|uniref:hypothetical protein n=1 Tax=Candidatus Protochlamydia sp. R18 TaxID=1353977 RepID=UPI0005AB5E08|nr:hypothetical protein [Candidatus Protochlamydia sp. R18]
MNLCVDIVNSYQELSKDVHVSKETGLPGITDEVAQKFLNRIGSSASFSHMSVSVSMTTQIPLDLCYSLYKFYFYKIKKINDLTDENAILIQLDKTKQIADKAIKEFRECMKLIDVGVTREMAKVLPNFLLNYLYGTEFVKLTGKIDPGCQIEELTNYFISQVPETKLVNFRLVIQKMRNIHLPSNLWAIDDYRHKVPKQTMIPAEVFARVHHRAMEDMVHLFHQHAANFVDKMLIDEFFEDFPVFQINKERVREFI